MQHSQAINLGAKRFYLIVFLTMLSFSSGGSQNDQGKGNGVKTAVLDSAEVAAFDEEKYTKIFDTAGVCLLGLCSVAGAGVFLWHNWEPEYGALWRDMFIGGFAGAVPGAIAATGLVIVGRATDAFRKVFRKRSGLQNEVAADGA